MQPQIGTLWTTFEPWQITQLQRLARFDPERLETILNTVWAMYPTLKAELAVSAVEQAELAAADAAIILGITVEEIAVRVGQYREASWAISQAQIVESDRGAIIEDTQVPVWEVVREYRKLGAVDRLTESFPGLNTGQLASALAYAREHTEEIEAAIMAYEVLRAQKRAAYPFA